MSLFRSCFSLLVLAAAGAVPATALAIDADGDTWHDDVDCDDGDPLVNPGATEICDTIDNDCDHLVDDADDSVTGLIQWYPDADGDGYGVLPPGPRQCAMPAGHASLTIDCDDNNANLYPTNIEICDDGIDQDCDERDTESTDDEDEDGHVPSLCSEEGTDCDDQDEDTYDGAEEECDDDVDQNCDGRDTLSTDDLDSDGETPAVCGGDGTDCNDNDAELHTRDDDNDGAAPCFGDCDDNEPLAHPAFEEVCDDGVDNDCSANPTEEDPDDDGVDDLDEDGDGSVSPLCGGPDCDDTDPTIRPAEEGDKGEDGATCADTVDNDCDGLIDAEDDDCHLEPEVDAGIGRQDRYLGGTILVTLDGTGTTDGNIDDTLTYTWTMITDTADMQGVTAELVTDPAEPVAYLRFSAEPGGELNKWTFDFSLVVSDGVFTTEADHEDADLRIEVFRPTVFGVDACSMAAPNRPSSWALAFALGLVGLIRRRTHRTL